MLTHIFLRGGEVTPKSITLDEANIAYDQTLGQGGCEISSIFYGLNALLINATQGILVVIPMEVLGAGGGKKPKWQQWRKWLL